MRTINLVLARMDEMQTELRDFRIQVRSELHAMNGRIDALSGRVGTVTDSVADLRRDFARHTHEA